MRGDGLLRSAFLSCLLAMSVGCKGGIYSLGYRGSYGASTAPPTSARGFATSLSYREWGGPIAKLLLAGGSRPIKPRGTLTDSASSETCYGSYCERTTTSTWSPPSREELEDYSRRVDDWSNRVAPAILSGGAGQSIAFELDVAMQTMGGDTSGIGAGFRFAAPLRDMLGLEKVHVVVGSKVGKYTMYRREVSRLTLDGEARSTRIASDIVYGYATIPIRISGMLGQRTGVYTELDIDYAGWVGFAELLGATYSPQLARIGLQVGLPFAYVTVEATADRMRPGSASLSTELGLAF